ncbi:MAG TPA: ROK family protein [Acidimicrobiales bacterium]|nr:ROK family protein [Acidimicrobiales bacterium]
MQGPPLGIDLGGTKMLALCIEEGHTAGAESTVASPRSGSELVDAVAAASAALCGGNPRAIGIGVPGLVDPSGTVRFAPNLLGISGTSLLDALARRFPSASLWVGNDATAACWAEHTLGAGAGSAEVLLVTLGTGIGGGIVSGGVLVEGVHRFAGEIGHMVVDPSGPPCPCGRNGCWERFASGAALGVLGRQAAAGGSARRVLELAGGDPAAVCGEHVTAAALEGDGSAAEIMDRFGWWVALGLANLANTLDPEMIVIGGGLVSAGEALMGPVRRWFSGMVEAADTRDRTRLLLATLGPKAGAIGAGLLARNAEGRPAPFR